MTGRALLVDIRCYDDAFTGLVYASAYEHCAVPWKLWTRAHDFRMGIFWRTLVQASNFFPLNASGRPARKLWDWRMWLLSVFRISLDVPQMHCELEWVSQYRTGVCKALRQPRSLCAFASPIVTSISMGHREIHLSTSQEWFFFFRSLQHCALSAVRTRMRRWTS